MWHYGQQIGNAKDYKNRQLMTERARETEFRTKYIILRARHCQKKNLLCFGGSLIFCQRKLLTPRHERFCFFEVPTFGRSLFQMERNRRTIEKNAKENAKMNVENDKRKALKSQEHDWRRQGNLTRNMKKEQKRLQKTWTCHINHLFFLTPKFSYPV